MSHGPVRSTRLAFKRAFSAYFTALAGPAVTDPTQAFTTAEEYLRALREQLGADEFICRLDDETTHLVGQVEQDLRQRWRDRDDPPDLADLEDRLRECLEHGLSRIDTHHRRSL